MPLPPAGHAPGVACRRWLPGQAQVPRQVSSRHGVEGPAPSSGSQPSGVPVFRCQEGDATSPVLPGIATAFLRVCNSHLREPQRCSLCPRGSCRVLPVLDRLDASLFLPRVLWCCASLRPAVPSLGWQCLSHTPFPQHTGLFPWLWAFRNTPPALRSLARRWPALMGSPGAGTPVPTVAATLPLPVPGMPAPVSGGLAGSQSVLNPPVPAGHEVWLCLSWGSQKWKGELESLPLPS